MKVSDIVFQVRYRIETAAPGMDFYVDAHCPQCDLDVHSAPVWTEDTIDAVIRMMLKDSVVSHLEWHEEGCPEEAE